MEIGTKTGQNGIAENYLTKQQENKILGNFRAKRNGKECSPKEEALILATANKAFKNYAAFLSVIADGSTIDVEEGKVAIVSDTYRQAENMIDSMFGD